jgi:ribosomal protein L44E
MSAVKGRIFRRGDCAVCGFEVAVKLSGHPRVHGSPACSGTEAPARDITEEVREQRKLLTLAERKAYDREYYQRNKERHNAGRRGGIRRHTQKRRAMLNRIKLERGCADCGYNAHAVALDFDHIGEKSADVSQLYVRSLTRLLDEIAKCEVVCANCHRIRTAQRAGWASSSPEEDIA